MSNETKQRPDSFETIWDAFQLIWRRATNQALEIGERALMSIPVNEQDSDRVVARAIRELRDLRVSCDLAERRLDAAVKFIQRISILNHDSRVPWQDAHNTLAEIEAMKP